jgi:hypothetical protein
MSPGIYQKVVLFVGAAMIVSVIGIVALSWGVVDSGSARVPDVLENIAAASLTGLLGLVANPRQ